MLSVECKVEFTVGVGGAYRLKLDLVVYTHISMWIMNQQKDSLLNKIPSYKPTKRFSYQLIKDLSYQLIFLLFFDNISIVDYSGGIISEDTYSV